MFRNVNEEKKMNGLFFLSLLLNFILFIVIIVLIPDFSREPSSENIASDVPLILGDFKLSYRNRLELLNKNNNCQLEKSNYLFLGDSITNRYEINKYFSDIPFVNSGVEGNKTSDILADMQGRIYDYNPTKVFLLIGTNQLEFESEDEIFEGIESIVEEIKDNRPFATIYVESIYPVNSNINGPARKKSNEKIKNINNRIKEYSLNNNVIYIDVYSSLLDNDGNLNKKYTIDGLHLSDDGYEKVSEILKKYVKEC
ncbi:MAG: hypothetical protein IJ509_02975 [Bacilli bacterium]|nr:hypothetical protein [Bacilli bacterium]